MLNTALTLARRSLPAVLALALQLPAPAGDRLYVGSTDFVLYFTDIEQPNLIQGGICGGAIHSLALRGASDVFIGDTSGDVYHFDSQTGHVGYAFTAGNDAAALAFHGGDLLVGGTDGTILRVDEDTGALLDTLTVGVAVEALLLDGDMVYAGSSLGVVFRGDALTGGFQFFGTCGGPVHSMARDGESLYLGTSGSVVYRLDVATQQLAGSFLVPNDAAAMVMHEGDLVVGGSNATIARVHRHTGQVESSFQAITNVQALALLEDPEPGVRSCFGLAADCPCGNEDGISGCANSSGVGSLLSGSGTASVAADDLVLSAQNIPANKFGRFYMGAVQVKSPFGDGLFCAGSGGYGVRRFPVFNSGASGTASIANIAAHAQANFPPQSQILPGLTWHFQVWYRDPTGPCGNTVNTSNAYSVTFLP